MIAIAPRPELAETVRRHVNDQMRAQMQRCEDAFRRGMAEPGADAFLVVEMKDDLGITGIDVYGPFFCAADTLRESMQNAVEVLGSNTRIRGYVVADVRAQLAELGITL